MYNNQDILKKHTALTVGHKDVDTSFIMFPVRLETRFVNNHPVEDVSEPDKVLYAFKSLWHYVEALRKKSTEKVLLDRALKLMGRVEGLDTVYREDKTRLKKLAAAIVGATKPTGDLARVWERIQAHIPRLATLDVVSDNEATDFLRDLDRVDRTIRRMYYNPDYDGKLRKKEDSHFSQTAKYKAARGHMKECLPVLERLLPELPSKSIVNRFSHITKNQLRKFDRVLQFFEIEPKHLNQTYLDISKLPSFLEFLGREIRKGLDNDFKKYEVYRDRYLGGGEDECRPRKQSLHDKMQSKVGRYHHYTLFAEKMILWNLRMATSHRDIATPQRVGKWRELASSTIFSYHEEREWLLKVLDSYNDFKAYEGKMSHALFEQHHAISPTRLNKNNRFIRNRKLHYRKNMKCLLIRVYPDEVAVTQLAKGLSAEEIRHARLFWVKYFQAGTELEREAAWKSLCACYAPPRAAFIARQQFPRNPEALKAAQEITEESNLDVFFPALTPVPDAGNDLFQVPMTELMPDRFVVQATLQNGGKDPYTIIQYGRLIPKNLQVGLDLNNAPEVERTPTGLKLGGNLRWMTDYDEAERMGMAITIPLESYKWDHYTKNELRKLHEKGIKGPAPKLRRFQFSSIYVTGVKEFDTNNEKDSKICSQLLQQVFNAHLYGDEGLELLKIGTPTNILDGKDENSTFDTSEEAQIHEFYHKSIVPLEDRVNPGLKGGDADLLSYLFGIARLKPRYKDNPFLNTANRDNAEVLKQQFVNRRFLELAMEEGSPLSDHPLLKLLNGPCLKEYFARSVSPVGVFPSFRIGDQPYGVVPVCDFQDLRFRKGDPLYLVRQLLLFLTKKWNALAHSAVVSEENMHRSRDTKLTTEERYLQAVGGTPYSSSFYLRKSVADEDLLDPEYFLRIRDNEREDPIRSIRTLVAQLDGTLSLQELKNWLFPDYGKLFVVDAGTEQFVADTDQGEFDWGTVKEGIKKDPEYGTLFRDDPDDQELNRFITGTFDLFNYRLDAWLTGLLNKRLFERMRLKKTHKISIGAYGWVFNLKEDPYETTSYEYVVAPSVNQAITAAVLRSSFTRSADGATEDYSLNVNLSSSRVRQALRIIDGVRDGLSVGAVLGSDLERALHEEYKKSGLEMDYFIYFLRQAYPLSDSPAKTLKAANNAAADKGFRDATIDVLNGSSLIEDFRSLEDVNDIQKHQLVSLYEYGNPRNPAGEAHLWKKLKKIFCETDGNKIIELFEYDEKTRKEQVFKRKVNKLVYLIQQMEDSYDALADVVTSESVYKLTQGNRNAVEALMGSLQTGRNIPEPEVTEIPLTSAHIDQRVFVALDAEAEAPDSSVSVMQITEPCLDQWLDQMLGFDRLTFPQVNRGTITPDVSLKERGITASELVYLSGDWDKFYDFLSVLDWLEHVEDGWQYHQDVSKPEGELIPLEDAEWAVDSMREMLSHARELRQSDLIATTEAPDESFDADGKLEDRYGTAKAMVTELIDELDDRVGSSVEWFNDNPESPLTDDDVLSLYRLFVRSFRIGVLDALSGVDQALLLEQVDPYAHPAEFIERMQRQKNLVQQADHIREILKGRLSKAEEARNDAENPSIVDAIRQLLPSSFRVIKPFGLHRNPFINALALERQKNINWFGNVNETVLEDELTGLADVRPQLNALHQLRMFAQWNGIDAPVRPMQLDTAEKDRRSWLGTQVSSEEDVHDANVYTVLNTDKFIVRNKNGEFKEAAGLVIDYWAERIPYRRQTAAMAFAYDQPDAEPPQAILVGVSTLGGNHNWSEKRMIKTIRSAMHQVQSRAVEPEHLYADRWTSVLFPLLRINPQTLK